MTGPFKLKKGKELDDFFKTNLTKKSGFGPRAKKGDDDQSKELAKSRYEMGEYNIDPFETDAETERREDAEGI